MIETIIAGGIAGIVESTCCHPFDTVKTTMQLKNSRCVSAQNPFNVASTIIKQDGFFSLYRGLTAVQLGITPKMAVRFSSFESYKKLIVGDGTDIASITPPQTFAAGIGSGVTEALLIVTPTEVCKIRMQSNVGNVGNKPTMGVIQTATQIIKSEGIGTLWHGATPTVLRQASNQGINFTTYSILKKKFISDPNDEFASAKHLVLGGLSGGLGPIFNNPLDVVKTRQQNGLRSEYPTIIKSIQKIVKNEGAISLWKGLIPRLMRIVPGQGITFMTYEFVRKKSCLFKSNP